MGEINTSPHISTIELKEYEYEENIEKDYNMDTIDAIRWRNMMAMIACSFPNLISLPILGCNGLPKRYLIVALEDIGKDEELCLDYGENHEVIKKKTFLLFYLSPER